MIQQTNKLINKQTAHWQASFCHHGIDCVVVEDGFLDAHGKYRA